MLMDGTGLVRALINVILKGALLMKRTKIGFVVLMLLCFFLGQTFAAACGDVDSNGSVNIVDALVIAQYYVGLNPSNFNSAVADVNRDSSINIIDALYVAQYYVGLISRLSCQSATPSPTATPTAGAITRIMPLGDSITDGLVVPGGYRIKLWSSIQSLGAKIDFVGSLSNGPAELGDKDHEGHSGWRIDQLDSNINSWMDTYKPKLVLLHIGTNDIAQNYDVANAPSRLSTLIDKICAKLPAGGKVYVAQIVPLSFNNQGIINFNTQIPGIVQSKVNSGKPVYMVDMYSALTTADLQDGVHPNRTGYDKMADVWFSAIRNDL